MEKKIVVKKITIFLGLALCFLIAGTVFRLRPSIRVFRISALDQIPILFDFLYGLIFASLVIDIFKGRKTKRVVFLFLYTIFCVFMFAEFIYCRIFGRIFGVKTICYAGEGTAFLGMVMSYFDVETLSLLGIFLIVGVCGYFLIQRFPTENFAGKDRRIGIAIFAFCMAAILLIPHGFQDESDIYVTKKETYQEWIDNKCAVNMFGAYEFLFRDIYLALHPKKVTNEEAREALETPMPEKENVNDMTGIFEGKNLVLVLLESMDDWLINKETTPTICKMMDEGINFANMYTPIFGSAATLNSEFCSYTGLIAPANGNPIVNYSENQYPYALPFLFREKGYSAKSFHYNSGEYYRRKKIHSAVGFEEYVSFLDYEEENIAMLDSVIAQNQEIYQKFTENTPFFNYIITYSAHASTGLKAYSHSDEALSIYPEYIGKFQSEEMDSISAKARLTDDMFAELMAKLEEDGLLENTVIAAFADHYDYTILDQAYLKELSKASNAYELSKTPFFIWAEGISHQEVKKVVNTTDIYPTICNLFGLDKEGYSIGRDIFDNSYSGYAFWQDGSWITLDQAFYSDERNAVKGIDPQMQKKMKGLIKEKLKINQLILDTDYYSKANFH